MPFAVLLLVTACSEDAPVGEPNLGTLDPTTYAAIGNSITAGYQSGALFEEGQLYSFPNLLAQAMGSTDFQQPLMPYPGTGELRILRSLVPSPVIISNGVTQNLPVNAMLARPFNNLGLPGAIVFDAIDESPILDRAQQRLNPFYMFIMRDQTAFGKTLVDQAIALQPTVLTFWLGNNDVLGYATSGGTRGTNTGDGGEPPRTVPTERALFQQVIQAAFAKIKSALPNTSVLVANIPDVRSVPFFTTVPRSIPNPTNPSQMLNIYYRNKEDNVGIVGEFDFVLLTAQEQLQKGVGLTPGNPLPSRFVLDNSEAAIVLQAITDYNTILMTEAERNGFVLVDMNAYFQDVAENGYSIAGEEYNAGFITGGMFSLDGIHLSARGNAAVANKFIEALNHSYNANIRYVSFHTIPGITAPETTGVGKRGVPWSLGLQFPDGHMLDVFGVR
ncbi:MAG: SGNH/GDSL hydrolase family protein [Bacteroidetes bacterium]|nr:SGNH/GDSL hydrolase family protein [Bacteroidota bacterium]